MAHYYDAKQDSRLKSKTVMASLRGRQLELLTVSGVFSYGKIDTGSRLLIEKCSVTGRVLDLGCGYGAVGVAVAPECEEVVLSDVNERAVSAARNNIRTNHIMNAEAVKSDLFRNVKGKFDTILLNPPQSAGKDVCFSMIEGAKKRLNAEGTLQLVARRSKGGRQLESHMENVFGNVRVLARGSGFRIYLSVAPALP